MAVRLRLKRTGRKNRPFYRIGAFHQTTRRDGRPVEDLGWYDPLVKDRDKSFEINEERAKYWLSVGAKASDTVRSMLKRRGIQTARG
ncbi:MAG: 30S ribosomal protein S16 [Planctomycetota bacterium]|jgi:small subunit ribosomal protein S16